MDMNPVDIQEILTLCASANDDLPAIMKSLTVEDRQYLYKDAIFFSGHKFVGGPGASGCLVVKKNILIPPTDPPSIPGGGSVFYVTSDHHRYSNLCYY